MSLCVCVCACVCVCVCLCVLAFTYNCMYCVICFSHTLWWNMPTIHWLKVGIIYTCTQSYIHTCMHAYLTYTYVRTYICINNWWNFTKENRENDCFNTVYSWPYTLFLYTICSIVLLNNCEKLWYISILTWH